MHVMQQRKPATVAIKDLVERFLVDQCSVKGSVKTELLEGEGTVQGRVRLTVDAVIDIQSFLVASESTGNEPTVEAG